MIACAALALALASAAAGEVVEMAAGQDCPRVRVAVAARAAPAVLRLNSSTIRGLHLRKGAGQLIVEGPGRIVAPAGRAGIGAAGYAVEGLAAAGVTLSGLTIANARTGVVWRSGSDGLTLSDVAFDGEMVDGLVVVDSRNVLVERSRFAFQNVGGKIHKDQVQWWGASDLITVRDSIFTGAGDIQGIGGLGPRPDGIRVVIERNIVAVEASRAISVAREAGVVRHNRVGTGDGRPLASIVLNPNIQACGNIALDFADNRQPAWAAPCPEPSE